MCVPRNKIQDLIWNIQWRQAVEFSRRVPSQCCVFLQTCGNKWMLQWQNMCTVKSILPMRCQSCWIETTNVEQNQALCDSHKFLIFAKSHLFRWWNIGVGNFVLRHCLCCILSLVCGRFGGEELLFINTDCFFFRIEPAQIRLFFTSTKLLLNSYQHTAAPSIAHWCHGYLSHGAIFFFARHCRSMLFHATLSILRQGQLLINVG